MCAVPWWEWRVTPQRHRNKRRHLQSWTLMDMCHMSRRRAMMLSHLPCLAKSGAQFSHEKVHPQRWIRQKEREGRLQRCRYSKGLVHEDSNLWWLWERKKCRKRLCGRSIKLSVGEFGKSWFSSKLFGQQGSWLYCRQYNLNIIITEID